MFTDTPAVRDTRRQWVRPQLRKIMAGEAENAMSGRLSDGPLSSGS